MADNLGNRPGHRPNDISLDIHFSVLLSRSLDVLGYNQDIIKRRIEYHKAVESSNTDVPNSDELIYSGSQKEGVVAKYESDIDLMCVLNDVICTEKPLPYMEDGKDITLFLIDNSDTEPGYTKLMIIPIVTVCSVMKKCLFQSDNGKAYISSELFTNIFTEESRIQHKDPTLFKAGPAVPCNCDRNKSFVDDMVICFKCYCPTLLRSWLKRPRRYNWPPPNILYDISQMEAHVVPVGCKGSDTRDQEWRICFTKAEVYLIHSLNDSQIKLYVILKIIGKIILKNICPEITSYILKNAILWLCELSPSEYFTEKQFVKRIFQALVFLQKCVIQNYLPNYMIPERNLFHGRIDVEQRLELINSLSTFIEKGPAALFLGLDKVCETMSLLYQAPALAMFCGIKRNAIETLVLLLNLRRVLIVPKDLTKEEKEQFCCEDEIYTNIEMTLSELVVPEWREIPNPHDIFVKRFQAILS